MESSDSLTKIKRSRTNQEEDDEPSNGFETLPWEIISDILSKLPISSLVQFKYVCRAWRLIGQDPNLLQLYGSRTAEENPCLVFHFDSPIRNQLYFVDFHGNCYRDEKQSQVLVVRKIQTPFCSSMPEYDVVGSCNGLLCLSDSLYNDSLYIYNPFMRDYRELPKTNRYPDQEVVFGFGFSPVTKEYKVVKVIYCYRDGNKGFFRHRSRSSTQSEVQVFTLGSSRWRSLGKVSHYLHHWPAVLVQGGLHWMTCRPRYRTGRNVVAFDLDAEEFREVSKPDAFGLRRCDYHLATVRGCLSAAFYISYGKMEIWVMKEYGVKESWVKEFVIGSYTPKAIKQEVNKYSINVSKFFVKGRTVRVLCVLKSGEILLEYKSRALALYDPESGKFKDLAFQGVPKWFQTIVHVGSLNQIDTLIGT
ncbi:F-box domain containing protein [Parasponia andersonii]|uniref:F-box domain containing protein n=1 Tax=Parasponia andersonii TaxID=3476 RepID=A0A2P5BCI0_PARAD|nr:F-box domain containing protein [Parasponia andersonii]